MGVGFVLLDLSPPNIHTLQNISLLIGLELGEKLYDTTSLRHVFCPVESKPTRQKAGGNTQHDAKTFVSWIDDESSSFHDMIMVSILDTCTEYK